MDLKNSSPSSPGGMSCFEVLDLPSRKQVLPEDTAVIGLSCRTAGGISTPEQLWDFLLKRKNASGDIPAHRWESWRQRYPRDTKTLNDTIRKGYFLHNLESFDAAFFGISPKEAECMDPHQRLGLELAWEALEHAGINPQTLCESDTAVYMGVDSDDYSRMVMEDLPTIEAWSGIGSAHHGVPNRISYHLGLRGPSTAVDAACASSLVAIHLAHQAIVAGESTVAICGGVNVICAPGITHMLQKAGALSTDGVCRSFDDAACGYARGEGGAVVVLKRLSAAIEDNDTILAVMKSSASAQDGRTNGIMAPSSKAQELVARQALLRAGDLDPLSIDYVEAHATSTALGDPTEISAIAQVYGTGRPSDLPCYVGSIKPNIGHLEAAAGAIGFVKAVLSVHKGVIAPQALLEKPNTKINWANSGLEITRETTQWPEREVRRAAVCCYGYGGSVCHAILEQAPTRSDLSATAEQQPAVTLTISAMQQKRLPAIAASLAHWLSTDGSSADLHAVARTLAQRRAAHKYRASFVVSDHAGAVRGLTRFVEDRPDFWTTSSRVLDSAGEKGAVWVYSGHGAQWPDMGKELLRNPVFYKTISGLEDVFQGEAGFSVIKALRTGDLCDSSRVQVLTYAMQIGLTKLLRSRGVVPQAIIGHSVGEIAAAVAAGCLTEREGAIVVSNRAKLYANVQGEGAMALVGMSFETAAEQLAGQSDIAAAIQASPSTCVVSGTTTAVESYTQRLAEEDVTVLRVQADIGFHSHIIRQLVPSLQEDRSLQINPQPAVTPIYSTSASETRSTSLRDAKYWTQNMVNPVWLVNAVHAAVEDGYRIFMEVSTHPIVSRSISETVSACSNEDSAIISTMFRGFSAESCVSKAISQLHTFGVPVDTKASLGVGPWCNQVPTTCWVHKSYWKNTSMGYRDAFKQHDVQTHTVLGGCIDIAGSRTKMWATTLDDTTKPYPLRHLLDGTEIIPAAVYCNTFQQAAGATVLDGIQLRVPTPMTTDRRELQVVIEGNDVRMASRLKPATASSENVEHGWVEHSAATFSRTDMTPYHQTLSIAKIRARISRKLPNSFVADHLQRVGVSGIAFPWAVTEHFGDEREMLVKVDMAPDVQTVTWHAGSWAPFLDAATSVGSSIFYKNARMRIVSGIDQILFISTASPPKVGYLLVEQSSEGAKLKADISILAETGQLLAKIKGMAFSAVETVSNRSKGVDSLIHRLAWVPPKLSETPLCVDSIVLVSEGGHNVHNYAEALRSLTEKVLTLSSASDLAMTAARNTLKQEAAVVVFVPGTVEQVDDIPKRAHGFTCEVAKILTVLADFPSAPKLFVITDSAYKGSSPTRLAQYSLYGFARVAASEYPHLWGGLIDNEGAAFPFLPMRYVIQQSVVRMQDGLPRVARLRAFSKDNQRRSKAGGLLPQPYGTYLVTGGFGDLGLEILQFLVRNGARRIVVVSRRPLPPRKHWQTNNVAGRMTTVVEKVKELEGLGASIHALALDLGSSSASDDLTAALDALSLPPVLGVVHAAGVSGYAFIKDTPSDSYASVMAPKIQGALNLHRMFPPKSLDFVVLFSSIGQIIGTPGQSAYAASNAFLDGLATHRRSLGCNTIAIQWTAWRALGLASNSALVDLELRSKGVTDITPEEAFQAWAHLSSIDTDHAVVTRTWILEHGEAAKCGLIEDVVQRRIVPAICNISDPSSATAVVRTKSGPELKEHLNAEIKGCLSRVLHLDVGDIDDRATISELGVDSVMTLALRQELQKTMGMIVPSTMTWTCPTVSHLVTWFYDKQK